MRQLTDKWRSEAEQAEHGDPMSTVAGGVRYTQPICKLRGWGDVAA